MPSKANSKLENNDVVCSIKELSSGNNKESVSLEERKFYERKARIYQRTITLFLSIRYNTDLHVRLPQFLDCEFLSDCAIS